MAFTSTPVAGGTTGSLANNAPAIDRIASVDFQRVKLTDATEGSTTATGVDGSPLKVKLRQRGSADYDSMNVAVATSLTAITAATIYPEGGYVANSSQAPILFTMTNTAGDVHCVFDVGPNEMKAIPVGPGCSMVAVAPLTPGAGKIRPRMKIRMRAASLVVCADCGQAGMPCSRAARQG